MWRWRSATGASLREVENAGTEQEHHAEMLLALESEAELIRRPQLTPALGAGVRALETPRCNASSWHTVTEPRLVA
jgi:hypothetical protein